MLCTSGYPCREGFLSASVQVAVLKHVAEPSVLQDGGEDSADAWGQGNWSEVGRERGVVNGQALSE